MEKYIALLRAVNVGGTGKLPMTDLRQVCIDAGFEQVKTYIASGNVVFTSRLRESKVKAELEQRLLKHTGASIELMVRTEAQIKAILAANPFVSEMPNRVIVIFLDKPPGGDTATNATGLKNESIRTRSKEIYVFYPDGMSKSKLKIPAAKPGTARNTNTVRKIAELLSELE